MLVNCIILKYFCLKQKHLKILLFYALIKKINGVGEKKRSLKPALFVMIHLVLRMFLLENKTKY